MLVAGRAAWRCRLAMCDAALLDSAVRCVHPCMRDACRLAYTFGPAMEREYAKVMGENQVVHSRQAAEAGAGHRQLPPHYPVQRVTQDDAAGLQDDAFATILQWLHARIPDTR